ncbi:MAG: sensor histidine kinase [Cytophagales bacterium]
MIESNKSERIQVFQLCFNLQGQLTFIDSELKLILATLNKSNILIEDIFVGVRISKLIKNKKSNFIPCINEVSTSGYVEILKKTELNENEWQIIFVKVADINVTKAKEISSEALFVLLDAILHPIFIKDAERRYIYVNKSFSVLYQISKKRVLGLRDEDFLHNQKEIDLLINSDLLVINDGEDVELPEYTHKRSDGERVSLFTMKLSYGSKPTTRLILGLTIDTTARKKNKKDLEKTSFELENFVYRTSHDLIAPIKTLKGLIYVGRLDPNNFLRSISLDKFEDVLRGLEIYIRELVDFAYNKSALVTFEKVNLKETIFKSYYNASKWMKHTETLLRMDVDQDFFIYSDLDRLKSVLHIVLSNAIQFSKSGKQYIDIKAYQDDKKLIIDVQDYGVGIKEQVIPKVFDMYYRGNQSSTGSGLGLYNAKETLKKIKGDIIIESKLEFGTKVSIILPLQKVVD